MSAVIPTVDEYARMSWLARQDVAKRLRKQLSARMSRDQRKADAAAVTAAVKADAALILANLPREPDHLLIERRAIANQYTLSDRRPA